MKAAVHGEARHTAAVAEGEEGEGRRRRRKKKNVPEDGWKERVNA